MFKIKMCGITTPEDLELADKLGADAAGFNFYPGSKRYLEIGICRDMIISIGPQLYLVGVFVNEDPDRINKTADFTGIDVIQLSGDEEEEEARKIERKTIKVIRPKNMADIKRAEDYPSDWIMFDTPVPGKFGGSGKTFDYDVITTSNIKRPFLLAGGLTPDNVSEIIMTVKPFGVDVASGVEHAPGKKDPEKMEKFIQKSVEAFGFARSNYEKQS